MLKGEVLRLHWPEFGNMPFKDLAQQLESHLAQTKQLPDAKHLLDTINTLLKSDRFSSNQRTYLKRLRQRTYDKKRRKISEPKAKPCAKPLAKENLAMPDESQQSLSFDVSYLPKTKPVSKGSKMHIVSNNSSSASTQPANFLGGITKALSKLDGERFICIMPKILIWFLALCPVVSLLFIQSVTLYQSAGFKHAPYAAAGGIIMLIGFAAYRSVAPSFLSLLLCIYGGSYEAYLMVSGTMQEETQINAAKIQQNSELSVYQEQANRSMAKYQRYKKRYQNPDSKVYQNTWFEKEFLNPSWEKAKKTQETFAVKKAALQATTKNDHLLWLKIFYRLGLVFLCMCLVHRLFKAGQ